MNKTIAAIAAVAACVLLTVCNNAVHGKPGNGLEQFTEGPVTIVWKGDTAEGVKSFQTNNDGKAAY